MHLVLTDALVCPQCGPGEGLIVLAERMENRRVLEGALGCPGCRRQYPIRGGLVDLRTDPGAEPAVHYVELASPDALALAALLGLTEGRGYALLLGSAAARAGALSALVPGLALIAVGPAAGHEEQAGVNRVLVDAVLPLRDRSMRGVVLGAGAPAHLGNEALRVLAIGGRLVISTALSGAEEMAHAVAVRELARAGDHIVVVRSH
jgi:uncharacterized protein YbaR (Trm112 family)